MGSMSGKNAIPKLDDLDAVRTALVQLARLSLTGRDQDTALYVQRTARKLRDSDPAVADALVGMLREAPTRSSPLRRASPSGPKEVEPILPPVVQRAIQQLIDERECGDELARVGLSPTRTALLLGPPGVGKTMAARWIAASLGQPLLLLDLSAVMSSLLGRTGMNLRHVLDYAKAQRCVLLIDELDSIGKRRNDDSDVGELKRLVTVMLQEVDQWPDSLLLGATNHPGLLDPAIWRRFEVAVEFPLPDLVARVQAVERFTSGSLSRETNEVLGRMFEGSSFSEMESTLQRSQRAVALGYGTLAETITEIAAQRASELAPDTIRKAIRG